MRAVERERAFYWFTLKATQRTHQRREEKRRQANNYRESGRKSPIKLFGHM